MVQNNKVLTVSYGTFSCTLEGFDDSFGTMKAIAEYFRDLASDDRYFGAEPPQPDADMLARIAQREISRQVEARTEQKHIVLRAAETEAAPADQAPAPAPQPDPAPQVEAAPQVETAQAPAPQPEPVVAPAPATPPVAAAPTPPEAPVAEAIVTPAPVENTPPPAPAAPPVAVKPRMSAARRATKPEVVPAADSIAAKLQRIREVVSNADQDAAALSYSEDEHAEDSTPRAVAAEAASDLSEAFEDETPSTEAFMSLGSDAAEDTYEAEPADEPVTLKPVVIESLFQDADDAEDDNALFGDLDDEDGDDSVEDDLSNILMTEEASDEFEEEAAPVHVLRIDPEAPASQTDDAPDGPDFATALSADDEADLLRELAAVEAELKAAAGDETEDAPSITDELQDKTPPSTTTEHATLPPVSDEGEDDNLSRLMAAADERLDNPSASTSRDTYSHLRAAAAVAEAERSADETPEEAEETDEIADGLTHVVRPRRPVATESTPRARVTNDRPAPLKLVAEQRVDLATDNGSTGPVLPRRVASAAIEETDSENGGFADYAAENGAVSLPDLLEAAAAYMSFVEGREQFSRPQLMNKVRQLDNQEFNREDGLRSFGQLLRDGKIEKTSGGRFTASGEIGFRPDNRAAG
ncbi:MAG: hypothetical protein AB3N15_12245 [Paracoccaceae bacterium]